ncbi:uncharacterized protein LOC107217241 [Neodiprion lecontei]|uniref:Uncharacterized protein LOC107217241 n=1 Tax=Neodiprion lecontei TaxID=441921 RepID=A0A6J0B7J8_NEOLC|nr:uncharacterized protein LOC107217241 [Neodiprion lecontei]XP_046595910.1 uncharacterized protein LOC107217241 [Neodiprion lecontei]XP_046595911.1 uncharacterized protein LOC107217241 [Neodiprion lecontei]
MSSQKGNAARSRPQKYQNRHAFKNNLHDTSHKTKFINGIDVANVCERCKQIIEWKIKYKKYKPLKAPSKCVKCEQKTVKHAYHIMCGPCAKKNEVCPKCGIKSELIPGKPTVQEQLKLDTELQVMLKALPERKRRTFIRYMNRKGKPQGDNNESSKSEEGMAEEQLENVAEQPRTREELLEKLKSLKLSNNEEDEMSDFEDEELSLEDDLMIKKKKNDSIFK